MQKTGQPELIHNGKFVTLLLVLSQYQIYCIRSIHLTNTVTSSPSIHIHLHFSIPLKMPVVVFTQSRFLTL